MSENDFINRETFELCKLRGRRTCFSATQINQRKCLLVLLDFTGSTGEAQKRRPSGVATWVAQCRLASERLGRSWLNCVPRPWSRRIWKRWNRAKLSAVMPKTRSRPNSGIYLQARPCSWSHWPSVPLSFWCGTTFHHRLIHFLTARFKIFLILP